MIQVKEQTSIEDFERSARLISQRVIDSIREHAPFERMLAEEDDSIYIKSVDGTILVSNPAYDRMFGGEVSPIGRPGQSFLTDSVRPISLHSDAMISGGCQFVQFDHIGHDCEGREAKFHTFKHSLMGLGHPTMAILGISRLVAVLSDEADKKQRSLCVLWAVFKELDELDRNVAIGLARGKNVAVIARENGVTKKTIENHRSAILRQLGFDSPIDVIKLIVRLQENGFGDFGV